MTHHPPGVWKARIRRLLHGPAHLVAVGFAYLLLPDVAWWVAAVFLAAGVLFGWRVLGGYVHEPGCAALRTRGRGCDCPVRGRT